MDCRGKNDKNDKNDKNKKVKKVRLQIVELDLEYPAVLCQVSSHFRARFYCEIKFIIPRDKKSYSCKKKIIQRRKL